MRGLLSAARRTGVLGNASPASPAAASGLLPARRVPPAGLGPPAASLLEAQKAAADRLNRRRRPRRLPIRATAAAAAEPTSAAAASAAPGDDNEAAPPPSFVVPPSEAYFGDLADPGVIANNTGLQLLFLGTGAGPAPTRGRGAPCVAVRTPHSSWLFDCGDDSQRALVREVSLLPAASSPDGSAGATGAGAGGAGAVATAPVRHGRISSFFVTSRWGGGALGLPGMLCISSASRVVKGAEHSQPGGFAGGSNGGGPGEAGLPPTSVSVFGPPGIANFLNEMLTLSDTYLAMPVLVHEFGYGVPSSSSSGSSDGRRGRGGGGIAAAVEPSRRGRGAVPVARTLSRRAKLSVATLLPDELNPFGFYDLQRAPRAAAVSSDPSSSGGGGSLDFGGDGGGDGRKRRTVDREEGDRGGFGFGFDARSGMREPDCLPGPGDPARAGADGLLAPADRAAATWTLRFDREFVVKCVPLIAAASAVPSSSEEKGGGARRGGEGGEGGGGRGAARLSPPPPPLSASCTSPFASAPGPDALAYVIRESARAGKIDAELAVSMGVTRGPMMAELKAGRSVTVAVPRPPPEGGAGWDELEGGGAAGEGGEGGAGDGQQPETRVVRPEEVVSPERPGRVVAILGDPLPPRSDAETLLPPPAAAAAAGRGREGAAAAAAEELARAAALAAFEAVLAVARDADLFVAGAGSAAAAAEVADRAGASAIVLTRFGKGDATGGGDDGDDGDDGEQDDRGGGGGGEKPPQQQQRKRYGDEDIAAEARAVLAARGVAPRLSAKVAAARDLDVVVLPRREAELVGKKP